MKKITYLDLIKRLLFFGLFLLLFSCDKSMTPYKKYVKDNEIVYPAKLDSFVLYTGKDRVQFKFILPPSPRLEKVKIYWNNEQDSIVSEILKDNDTLVVNINQLKEGPYLFDIYSYDYEGNKSIKTVATTKVYGDQYQMFLNDRPITFALHNIDSSIKIIWGNADISNGAFATEIRYVDTLGEEITHICPVSDSTSIVPAFNPSLDTFSYRTLYLPDSLSLDTFYTNYRVVDISGFKVSPSDWVEIDKSNWKITDYSTQHPGGQNLVSHLIDGDPATRWVTWVGHSHYPHFVVIDMQALHNIAAFQLFRVTDGFVDRAPDTVQFLISQDNKHWINIGKFKFNRFTNEGQMFPVPSGYPIARYVKFVGVLGPLDYMAMGELNVYKPF